MARPHDPEREAERRTVILQAAARAFTRDGLQGTSIASICKEAGISPGHLYYYFSSKESLIEAMAAADLAGIRTYAEQLNTLDDLLDAAVASIDPSGGPEKMLAGPLAFDIHAEAQRNPRLRDMIETHYRSVSAIFGSRLAAAQLRGQVAPQHDPQELARLVGALREGLLMMASITPDFVSPQMKATARAMLDRLARDS